MLEKRIIGLCVFVLKFFIKTMMLHSDKGFIYAMSAIHRMSQPNSKRSKWYRKVALRVSADFQKDLAEIMGLSLCQLCKRVIPPNQTHGCIEEDK